MNRQSWFYLALVGMFFFAMLPSQGQERSPANAADTLRQLEQQWLASVDDPDALQSILAEDFVHVLPSGFVTKSQQIAYLRAHPKKDDATKRLEDLKVRIYGTWGIVNGFVVATEKDGSIRRTVFTDVFALRNGQWKAVNAQELLVK